MHSYINDLKLLNSTVRGTVFYHVQNTHGDIMVQFINGDHNMLVLQHM